MLPILTLPVRLSEAISLVSPAESSGTVPLLSAGLTRLIASLNRTGNVKIGNITYASAGQNVVILLAAAVAFLLGMRSYRQMDDRKGVPLREDLISAVRNEPLAP